MNKFDFLSKFYRKWLVNESLYTKSESKNLIKAWNLLFLVSHSFDKCVRIFFQLATAVLSSVVSLNCNIYRIFTQNNFFLLFKEWNENKFFHTREISQKIYLIEIYCVEKVFTK